MFGVGVDKGKKSKARVLEDQSNPSLVWIDSFNLTKGKEGLTLTLRNPQE